MNSFQQQGRTKFLKGSILTPETAGLCFVLNVANKAGKLESPLYPLFDKKWKRIKEDTKGWFTTQPGTYKLGTIHDIAVQSDVWVITLLCQDENLKTDKEALNNCLKKLCTLAKYEHATIHVSDLLLNLIPELKESLTNQLLKNGVSVYYYEEK